VTTLIVRGPARIDGRTTVPGDKSISHRALMLAAIANGASRIGGLAPGADVAATRRCLQSYGVAMDDEQGAVIVHGRGSDAWRPPGVSLDCANSGTTMRLLAGLAAHHEYESCFDGDASLRRRPMDRIAAPLRALGAHVDAREEKFPPISIRGGDLHGAMIDTGVPSAQVKSCALLAGLRAEGETVVREQLQTRDHTERMLGSLGAPTGVRTHNGATEIFVKAFEPPPFDIDVCGDPSSAAFLVTAALLCGNVRLDGVCVNPTRVAFYQTCARMGGSVRVERTEERHLEPVGWIEAKESALHGVGVEGPLVPQMIDEIPLIAVLATAAQGSTTVTGAAELRVKESDRIAAIAVALRAMGADIDERPDGFEVRGPTALGGITVDAQDDHRIAMALAVAGLAATGETRITGFEAAGVSWPGFESVLTALGADVEIEV
jgi:3-phosphoshikimate 1-carboxyvinyltransferase